MSSSSSGLLASSRGGLTVEAAAAVALQATNTCSDAIDRLADLVAKSLVVVDVNRADPRFRAT